MGRKKLDRPRCDLCNRYAVVNLQKSWRRYDIGLAPGKGASFKDAEYKEDKTWDFWNNMTMPVGDNNVHLCETHESVLFKYNYALAL